MKHIVRNTFALHPDDDPAMVALDDDGYLQFTETMCEWLLDHDIDGDRYATWTTPTRYLIWFHDDRDALFFRIAWS